MPAKSQVEINEKALQLTAYAPGVTDAALSPDGNKIATIAYRNGSMSVYIGDAKGGEPKAILGEKRAEDGFWRYQKRPSSVIWLNNDVIIVNFNLGAASYTLEGKFIASLGERVIRTVVESGASTPVVIAYTDIENRKLARIDALTGRQARYSLPMSGTPIGFTFDKQGEPRVVTMADSTFWNRVTTFSHWYKRKGAADWKRVVTFNVTDDIWVPIYVPPEENRIVVSSRAGRDTSAIFMLDTDTGKLGEMMAGSPQVDIVGVDRAKDDSFDRVFTSGMRQGQVWFDAAWATVQASVDAALPKRLNHLSGNPAGTILVHSKSDVDPGTHYILDTKNASLKPFARYHETIDAAQMRPMETLTYPSFDRLQIPAYLTLPKGDGKRLPTVIMIHGGPQERDYWEFNEEVQMLANRGYAVLQPQFRGSTGFGSAFEVAGYGQWGLAMQDDVSAGVEYLIARGIADPGRICIYGSSYGGYAALWGLVKTPQLYKCGISFAGVSDIESQINDSPDVNANKITMELVRSRIGDPKVNKQQFDLVSPQKHAARFTAPVLVMHGKDDERVPFAQASNMVKALKENGKQVESLYFENEGHGLHWQGNKLAYYRKMLAFLDQHIGPRAQGASAPTEAGPGTPPAQP